MRVLLRAVTAVLVAVVSTATRATPPLPHILGAIALPAPSRLSEERRQALLTLPSRNDPRVKAMLEGLESQDPFTQLEQVNLRVNRYLEYHPEEVDDWSSAQRSLARHYGDCEDFAIVKMQLLRLLGFSSEHLYLVIVSELGRRSPGHPGHAYLAAYLNGRFIALYSRPTLLPLEGHEGLGNAQAARSDFFPRFSYAVCGSSICSWAYGIPRLVQ